MDDDLEPRAGCVCTELRKANRAITRLYDEALQPAGMSTVQFSLLRALERRGALPLSRLADAMVMDRTSLYRTLEPLERRGWIALEAGRGKTRVARLSASGREALAAALPHWQAVQALTLDGLGAADWAHLRATLGRLARSEPADAAPTA